MAFGRRVAAVTRINLSTAFLFSLLLLCGCTAVLPQSQPDWVAHAAAAKKAFASGSFAEADKEAKLVLDEANRYGGKTPPWAASKGFELFPDPEESYTGSLIALGERYEHFEKWNDAERFYRAAIKLEINEFGPSSPASTIGMPALIDLLKKTGRTKEAIAMQQKLLTVIQSDAAHDGGTLVKQHALDEEAKLSNLKGKPADEEAARKRKVDLYQNELTDKGKLAEMKRRNTESWSHRGGVQTLYIIGSLEDLARYYDHREEYAKEEAVLLQAQSARQEVLPESSLLADGWQNLARVYENEHKYAEAAKALESAIKCLEIDKVPQQQTSLAFDYGNYSRVLEMLGRESEAIQAKQTAHKLYPTAF